MNYRLFSTSKQNDPEAKVLNDIEKGGTFNARKRKPKIISKELNEKLNSYSSDSSGEYLFSSQRKREMMKDSINSNTTAFSTSYSGAFSGPKNEQDNLINAFVTDAQSNKKISFSGGGKQQNLSDFKNISKKEPFSINNKELAAKIKKLAGTKQFFNLISI